MSKPARPKTLQAAKTLTAAYVAADEVLDILNKDKVVLFIDYINNEGGGVANILTLKIETAPAKSDTFYPLGNIADSGNESTVSTRVFKLPHLTEAGVDVGDGLSFTVSIPIAVGEGKMKVSFKENLAAGAHGTVDIKAQAMGVDA